MNIINTLERKYEVRNTPVSYILIAPKGRVVMVMTSQFFRKYLNQYLVEKATCSPQGSGHYENNKLVLQDIH